MCLKWFRKKPLVVPPPAPLAISHPEEPRDPSATLETVNVRAVINTWFADWEVPPPYQVFWRTVEIVPVAHVMVGVTDCPAATWADTLTVKIQPGWCNAGVIAHEMAHISWSLLIAEQQVEFASLHDSLKDTEPLMTLLYSQNGYGLTSAIEGHAEIYRYLGAQMPAALKRYYPKLMRGQK